MAKNSKSKQKIVIQNLLNLKNQRKSNNMESIKFPKTRLLRVNQAAERLNCSTRFIYCLAESGKLEALKLGNKKGLRIPEDVLEKFVKKQRKKFCEDVGYF